MVNQKCTIFLLNCYKETACLPIKYQRQQALRSLFFHRGKTESARPKADKLKKIADYFGVSVDYLLGTDAQEKFQTNLAAPEDVAFVQILRRVPAGVPIAAITDVEGTVDIPVAWTRSAEYFALRIRGSSMEPRIHDGDIVIIRLSVTFFYPHQAAHGVGTQDRT